jgi:hypothetical protein
MALVFAACAEEPATAPGEASMDEGTVRATVVTEPQAGGITVTKVRIDAKSLELGAYQGRFNFDPGVLEFVDVTMPEEDYRFVNTAGAEQGEIRFAGFTVDGFDSPLAMVMQFRSRHALEERDVAVNLEVVGDLEGIQVEQRRILRPTKEIREE